MTENYNKNVKNLGHHQSKTIYTLVLIVEERSEVFQIFSILKIYRSSADYSNKIISVQNIQYVGCHCYFLLLLVFSFISPLLLFNLQTKGLRANLICKGSDNIFLYWLLINVLVVFFI